MPLTALLVTFTNHIINMFINNIILIYNIYIEHPRGSIVEPQVIHQDGLNYHCTCE